MAVKYSYLDREFPELEVDGIFRQRETLTERILARIAEVIKHSQFTIGPEVGEFEDQWAAAVGTKHAVGVSNGTDAIFLALKAAGVRPGDRVATSPVSFIATVGAILQAGATPVFVDIGDDHQIDMQQVVDLPEPVQYVVPVCWAGGIPVADEDVWASKTVIVDAAQAIGSNVAELIPAHAYTYSLHPLKNLNVLGDGGMIATDLRAHDLKLRSLRNHGLKGRDLWLEPGYNHRLSTLQAAVGLEVIKELPEYAQKRKNNAVMYDRLLADIPQVKVPPRNLDVDHSFHLYQIELPSMPDRERVKRRLNDMGIEVKVHYDPVIPAQPALRHLGYEAGSLPRAEKFAKCHLTLPIHPWISENDIHEVVNAIRGCYPER